MSGFQACVHHYKLAPTKRHEASFRRLYVVPSYAGAAQAPDLCTRLEVYTVYCHKDFCKGRIAELRRNLCGFAGLGLAAAACKDSKLGPDSQRGAIIEAQARLKEANTQIFHDLPTDLDD